MSEDVGNRNQVLAALYAQHIGAVTRRHDRALDIGGASHIVIFSGSVRYAFLDDRPYPFRANPHFLAWLPLDRLPQSYVVYTPGDKPRLIYFRPHDYWHVTPGEPDGIWTEHFDVRIIHDADEAARHLPDAREKCVLIGEIDSPDKTMGIERVNPTSVLNSLHFARARKTGYELECMRLANRRAARGHAAAAAAFRKRASEYAIHQAYCEAVSHTDEELPYANIVALNEHGSVLHYTELERDPPGQVRSFLIDAGAQFHGYAADVTRTYSYGDKHFQAIIERLDIMQRELVDRVHAGISFRDLHLVAHRLLAVVLVDVDLASGSVDSLVNTGVTAAFFPHGLGHLLGLQVHDVGGFMSDESGARIDPPSGHPYLRLTRRLERDMVVTIEPGLYVIDMLLEDLRNSPAEQHLNWDTVAWLRPFGGIRIEDDVRVGTDSCENLTRKAFDALL